MAGLELTPRVFCQGGWLHTTVTVDCHYKDGPGVAAVYLLVSRQADGSEVSAAFVDASTAQATPRLLSALAAQGARPEDVRFVAVTHAHLDHCAGTAALLVACPGARALCHPRAARHLTDPKRLKSAAEAVYGAAAFRELYGSVDAVDPGRVGTLRDEASVPLCSARSLRFLHVRGHAPHHLVVHDPATRCLFVGDAMGICYTHRMLGAGLRRPVLYPATPPGEFEPQEAREAVRRISLLEGVDEYMLAHFGGVPATAEVREELLAGLEKHEAWYREALVHAAEGLGTATSEARVLGWLLGWLGGRLRSAGASEGARSHLLQDFLRQDLEIHAKGVVAAARRGKAAQRGPAGRL
mmetsp:Transcript_29935/g.93045  ORF Transcript_29935/g.93045 Transcript_29935/m.93045 type:complete len:354 (+) Transcript_29935:28-1089(+)